MYELAKVAGYLASPLTIVMGLWIAAATFSAMGRRTAGLRIAILAFAALWIASMPIVASTLSDPLERRYPAIAAEAAAPADVILVLGGAVIAAQQPERPTFSLTSSSDRVWQAAALYRAGKAKWVLVAAGGERDIPGQQIEADAIAQMLVVLGVPKSALLIESASRNTRENAANALELLQQVGAGRVLLVTSARHMPRAMQTFARVWAAAGLKRLKISAFPTDAATPQFGHISLNSFLPAVGALENVTHALKEYAGMLALAII